MKTTAFLYPGQGAQSVGMGIDAVGNFSEAADIFLEASDIVGYDMKAMCAEGPIEKLSQTENTQPAIFTVEAALTTVLSSRGVKPAMTAGHSLGEFGAWFAAGVFSFADGLKLVAERGRLMANADPADIGTMAAIIGLDYDTVAETCASVGDGVVVANINQPAQMVISGIKEDVARAGELLSKKGAKRVMPLKVSGAFHSPLMNSAKEAFTEIVKSVKITSAEIPVYANVTAGPVTDADEIRKLMVEQLTSPVRWIETITAMRADGLENAFEVGPGAVISGLVKRIDRDLSVVSVSDHVSIQEVTDGQA